MKQLINKFLKEQKYTRGQIYKVCPNVLLDNFIKFAEKSFLERYEVNPEFMDKGFGWILHKNWKGDFDRIYMKSKKEAEKQNCKVYKTVQEEVESMRYYGLQ